MAEIIRITSEALQATVRRLLPSQQGFGEDLQASNVIMPVIDVTPTAEGTQLPPDLARAPSYGSITAFEAANNVVTIANTPGFWRVFGTLVQSAAASNTVAIFELYDGTTAKALWKAIDQAGTVQDHYALNFDFTVFLDTGESLLANSNSFDVRMAGSTRQVADRYGNTINPAGFTFE